MGTWFEGSSTIDVSLEEVAADLEDRGRHFLGVVRNMPGMTSVELVEQDSDKVIIRTNEGLMTRSNISTTGGSDRLVVEFDETYVAGSSVTVTAHFTDEFTSGPDGVTHRLRISDLTSTGLLGFFYRRFASSKMGKAFLNAAKAHLEADRR